MGNDTLNLVAQMASSTSQTMLAVWGFYVAIFVGTLAAFGVIDREGRGPSALSRALFSALVVGFGYAFYSTLQHLYKNLDSLLNFAASKADAELGVIIKALRPLRNSYLDSPDALILLPPSIMLMLIYIWWPRKRNSNE